MIITFFLLETSKFFNKRCVDGWLVCGGSFFRSCFSSTLEEETDPKKYEVKAKDSQLYTRAAARASFLLYFTILWSCKIKTSL